jgi:ABC-type phosphate transport system substrate-binding protein
VVPAVAANVTLGETGSTLVYPLFKLWISDYATVAPNVTLTAAGTGSGAGIAAAISGEARIGTSDAYMSDEEYQQNRGILNIPLAISTQTVNYNIPGLNGGDLKSQRTGAGRYLHRQDHHLGCSRNRQTESRHPVAASDNRAHSPGRCVG